MSFPFQITPTTEDEKWMCEALKEAWKAYKEEEVPIGAVLVHEGKVIARGHNQVETLQDATAHAELLTITSASAALRSWRLQNTTLYTTLEPCMMCLGSIFLSRVKRVVYGAKDIRHGALGSFVNLLEKPHPTHSIEVVGGVLESFASQLMKDFFREQRNGRETS